MFESKIFFYFRILKEIYLKISFHGVKMYNTCFPCCGCNLMIVDLYDITTLYTTKDIDGRTSAKRSYRFRID